MGRFQLMLGLEEHVYNQLTAVEKKNYIYKIQARKPQML